MSQATAQVKGVNKIAVLRANALGDYIFSLPALDALRNTYPQAEIILLGKQWHAQYLEGRPGPVDRVIVLPRYRGVGEEDTWEGPNAAEQGEIDAFFNRMAAEKFDLALQMHGGGGNSNPFVHRLAARVTAGLRAPEAPPLDRWAPYVYWQSEFMRLLEVVRLVGAEPVTVEPHLAVTQEDILASCEVVPETLPSLVVIHPGASDPRRRWPAERFAVTADRLSQAGHAIAIIGIESEREVVNQVGSRMTQPHLDLCGKLSLNALTGLLSRSALLIGNDSGPRHLAEAVGKPTVGLYWCGNLINAGPMFRTLHRPHLSWRIHCPACGSNTLREGCTHQESFIDEIPVEEVLQSAADLLSNRTPALKSVDGQPS